MVHQDIQPIMETATCMDDATPKRALKQCKMDTYALIMTHQNKRKNTFKLVKNRLRQQTTSTTLSPCNRCTGHGSRAKNMSRPNAITGSEHNIRPNNLGKVQMQSLVPNTTFAQIIWARSKCNHWFRTQHSHKQFGQGPNAITWSDHDTHPNNLDGDKCNMYRNDLDRFQMYTFVLATTQPQHNVDTVQGRPFGPTTTMWTWVKYTCLV